MSATTQLFQDIIEAQFEVLRQRYEEHLCSPYENCDTCEEYYRFVDAYNPEL